MAYAIVHFFPGGTKKHYEASISAVHPAKNSLPKGQIFHAAGPSAGGWTVVAVHESKEPSRLSGWPTALPGWTRPARIRSASWSAPWSMR